MALPVNQIQGTDKLESGFRAKANGNFNSIVVESEVDENGNLILKSPNGNIISPLGDFFASKLYAQNVSGTPPASETVAGRVRAATDEEAIAGVNDSTFVSPSKMQHKINDYINNLDKIGYAVPVFKIGSSDFETLLDVLGKIGLGDNFIYDASTYDNDGNAIERRVGIDTEKFVAEKDLEVAGVFSVNDNFTIENTAEGDDITAEINAQNKIIYKNPETDFEQYLGVNEIGGIGGAGVTVNNTWTFGTMPILPTTNPTGNNPVSFNYFNNAIYALSVGGFDWYGEVTLATTEDIILYGHQEVDGLMTGSIGLIGTKVLVKDKNDPSKNGLYMAQPTEWIRLDDYNSQAEIYNKVVSIAAGEINRGSQWICRTTPITINVTGLVYEAYSRNYIPQDLAYLSHTVNPQEFFGQIVFSNDVTVISPVNNWNPTTKAYVDAADTLNATTLSNALANLSNQYWPKIGTKGIGTVNSDTFDIYQNNVKRIQLSGSTLSGIEYFYIGGFNSPYGANGIFDYGLSVKKSLNLGYFGGLSANYSLDISTSNNPIAKSSIRFGKWIPEGNLTGFKRGIEYDYADNLIIGTYTASIGSDNGKIFSDDSRIIIPTNGFFGVGITPTERLHVNGNALITGVIKPSGNAPTANNQFLVSNGTTGNKYINFGEFGQFQTHEQYAHVNTVPHGISFVKGTSTGLPNSTTQGHIIKMGIGSNYASEYTLLSFGRPFSNYFDGRIYLRGVYGDADSGWIAIGGGDVATYTTQIGEGDEIIRGIYYESTAGTKEAFVGIDAQNGGLLMRLNVANNLDSSIATFENRMNIEDGRLQYYNGSSFVNYLIQGEGGGTGGAVYSFPTPFYLDGSAVRIQTASSTLSGILSATDYVDLKAKVAPSRKVDTTAPLMGGGDLSQNITISIPEANGSTHGYLSQQKFTEFSNKLGQGSTVTSFLNYTGEGIYFNRNPLSDDSDGYMSFSGGNLFVRAKGLNTLQLIGNVVKISSGPNNGGVLRSEVEIGSSNQFSGIKVNGSLLNFYMASTPTNGTRFVLEYNNGAYRMVTE